MDPTTSHPAHRCRNCTARADQHATLENPYAPAACPVGPFPRWTKGDDREPGRFDRKIERFWRKSKSQFKPM